MKISKAFFLFSLIFLTQILCVASAAVENKTKIVYKIESEKKSELNGTSWDVVMGGEKDVFTFQKGQFRSEHLFGRGFSDTNYIVHVSDDVPNAVAWETMQTGKEGVVFIQGEWTNDKMQGNVTELLDDGRKTQDYSFITSRHWQPQKPVEHPKLVEQHKMVEIPQEIDKFSEEIEKFEKAQASALKPAR